MSGLRETKKAATRTALSRAAAEIALDEGPEELTVAAIAARAGVSTRTFHNYFTSREGALLEFISERVRDLISQFNDVPEDLGLLAAVEHLVVEHLRRGESELDSFRALFRISEILEGITPTPEHPETSIVVIPLLPAMLPRSPGLEDFEASVAIHLIVSALRVALDRFYRLPEPRDVEVGVGLVSRSLRLINLEL